jgi:hypothetical protein
MFFLIVLFTAFFLFYTICKLVSFMSTVYFVSHMSTSRRSYYERRNRRHFHFRAAELASRGLCGFGPCAWQYIFRSTFSNACGDVAGPGYFGRDKCGRGSQKTTLDRSRNAVFINPVCVISPLDCLAYAQFLP